MKQLRQIVSSKLMVDLVPKMRLTSKKSYNIKRHLEQKHGEDDISNVDKNLSISVTQYSATLTSRDTISQFLVKLALNQYVKIFKENHI